jgi:predicted transcriptional regulator
MNILIEIMARKNMTTSIDNDLQKEIKKLAIDLERPFNDIIAEEALKDLLKKYEKQPKK